MKDFPRHSKGNGRTMGVNMNKPEVFNYDEYENVERLKNEVADTALQSP